MDVSRIKHGHIQLRRATGELRPLIEDAAEAARPLDGSFWTSIARRSARRTDLGRRRPRPIDSGFHEHPDQCRQTQWNELQHFDHRPVIDAPLAVVSVSATTVSEFRAIC